MGCWSCLVAVVLILQVVWSLGFVSASFSTFPGVCGYDQLEFLELPDGNFLSINGRMIDDPFLICNALESYLGQDCFISDPKVESWRMRVQHCGRDFAVFDRSENGYSSVNIVKQAARKFLLQLPVNASSASQANEQGQLEGAAALSDSQDISFALPGIVLLCCGVLCPCFHAKRRDENEQSYHAAQLNSMESVSSVEISSPSEKIVATPRVPPSPSRFASSPQLSRVGSVHLNINQIYKATQNFSPSLKLGEGGFGSVYKGVLPDGQIVAIKRAKKEHISALRDEFSNEVELLAKIEHRNLVRLLGYLDRGNERIIITEYVPNGTLREHLDGQLGKILDFNQRLEIAIDVAHALTYLHLYSEKIIIHRDVKSSNILLTESYRAKVSDFGFARSGPTDADQTHISTKVKGTAGYLDPEYLRTYQLTPKSDVFSFGILLIEIVSGRRPVDLKRNADERITVRWAFKKHNEGNLADVVDPLLQEKLDDEVVGKMLELAFHCAAPTRNDRPDMKEVVEQLWEIRKEYVKSLRT